MRLKVYSDAVMRDGRWVMGVRVVQVTNWRHVAGRDIHHSETLQVAVNYVPICLIVLGQYEPFR